MSVRQLYNLQRIEQEIAHSEQGLARARAAIGESPPLKRARDSMAQANDELNALKAEQKVTEYAITDISAKITVVNESLYSGRIKNPKELQNLQHELDSLRSHLDPLEEKDLSLMEQAEACETKAQRLREALTGAEKIWLAEQQALLVEIGASERALSELQLKRQEAVAAISADDLTTYNHLKRTRGWGIAMVEQGTCSSCRLTLSSAELQRARTGQTTACSSCGRLLFFE